MASFRDRIESDELLFDSAIVSHGYAPYLRDYDVVVEVPAALPPEVPICDTVGSYLMGRYRFRFTHCPEVHVITTVGEETWRRSWDDVFIDYAEWDAAGNPEGYVWGVNYADAYPGLSYVQGSPLAQIWTNRLEREMHELTIETHAWNMQLVCHDLLVHRLAVGDPWTRTLNDLDEPELVG